MKCDNFFAFLGGLIVGAGAAILFAPESGAETRKKIKNTFRHSYKETEIQILLDLRTARKIGDIFVYDNTHVLSLIRKIKGK